MDANLLRRIVVMVFLTLSSPLTGVSREPNPKDELQQLSESEGLAVARIQSSNIEVITFDGKRHRLRKNPRGLSSVWVSATGRFVAWAGRSGLSQGFCIEVESMSDSASWHRLLGTGELLSVSVSNDGGRAVVAQQAGSRSFITVFDQNGGHRTRTVDGLVGNLSWSPDATKFAYDGSGGIEVLSIDTGTRTRIGSGTSPTWSPDGRLLTWRTSSGEARAYEVESRTSFLLFGGKRIGWGVHWSPDSRFVMTTTFPRSIRATLQGRVGIKGPVMDVTVQRLQDLSLVSEDRLPVEGSDDRGYFWVNDYRRLLAVAEQSRESPCGGGH